MSKPLNAHTVDRFDDDRWVKRIRLSPSARRERAHRLGLALRAAEVDDLADHRGQVRAGDAVERVDGAVDRGRAVAGHRDVLEHEANLVVAGRRVGDRPDLREARVDADRDDLEVRVLHADVRADTAGRPVGEHAGEQILREERAVRARGGRGEHGAELALRLRERHHHGEVVHHGLARGRAVGLAATVRTGTAVLLVRLARAVIGGRVGGAGGGVEAEDEGEDG